MKTLLKIGASLLVLWLLAIIVLLIIGIIQGATLGWNQPTPDWYNTYAFITLSPAALFIPGMVAILIYMLIHDFILER